MTKQKGTLTNKEVKELITSVALRDLKTEDVMTKVVDSLIGKAPDETYTTYYKDEANFVAEKLKCKSIKVEVLQSAGREYRIKYKMDDVS